MYTEIEKGKLGPFLNPGLYLAPAVTPVISGCVYIHLAISKLFFFLTSLYLILLTTYHFFVFVSFLSRAITLDKRKASSGRRFLQWLSSFLLSLVTSIATKIIALIFSNSTKKKMTLLLAILLWRIIYYKITFFLKKLQCKILESI